MLGIVTIRSPNALHAISRVSSFIRDESSLIVQVACLADQALVVVETVLLQKVAADSDHPADVGWEA